MAGMSSMRGVLLMMTLWELGCGAHGGRPAEALENHGGTCTPELYGAGLFTTGAWDFFMAFSPDQRRVLFGRADDQFQQYTLYETQLTDEGHWSRPVLPRFATEWSNADPHLSPDGRTVYFISNRPEPGEQGPRSSYDIWAASLDADGAWEDARRLPAPVNDKHRDEWSPAVAANGNLYFGGERDGTLGGSDLWVSRWVDGAYQPPENLGPSINSSVHELEPWIAPDESYLIFSALRREDGLGGYDLFLSRNVDGAWRLHAGSARASTRPRATTTTASPLMESGSTSAVRAPSRATWGHVSMRQGMTAPSRASAAARGTCTASP